MHLNVETLLQLLLLGAREDGTEHGGTALFVSLRRTCLHHDRLSGRKHGHITICNASLGPRGARIKSGIVCGGCGTDSVSQPGNASLFATVTGEAAVHRLIDTLSGHVARPVLLVLVMLISLTEALHIIRVFHVLERITSLQRLLFEEL